MICSLTSVTLFSFHTSNTLKARRTWATRGTNCYEKNSFINDCFFRQRYIRP